MSATPDNIVPSSLADPVNVTSLYGSGGNYFSNEIFYRVARLRTKSTTHSNLPTGHLHVPKVQKDHRELTGVNDYLNGEDLTVANGNRLELTQVVQSVKKIIEASLSGI